MKTLQYVSISLMTCFFIFTSCSKDETDMVPQSNPQNTELRSLGPGQPVIGYLDWFEDFATASSLTSHWYLSAVPPPRWVSFAAGKSGLLENYGNLPNGSCAISKTKIGFGTGYTIESDVYINLTNPNGAVINPGIGVTRSLFLPPEFNSYETGISMALLYLGNGVPGVPPELENSTQLIMIALSGNGEPLSYRIILKGISPGGDNSSPGKFASNGWHTMKIVVTDSGQVSFYFDGLFIWSPQQPIHSSLMTNKNIFVGFMSPGQGGTSYNNSVRVSYPLPH